MKQYRNKILLIVLVGILLLINLPFHAILQTASMGGDAEQAVTQLFEKNATATDTDADRATPEDADRATVEDADGVAAKAVDGEAAEDTDRATLEDADAMTTQDIALSYEDQAKQIATISDAISRDVYTPDMKVEIKKEKKSYIFNIDALATVMSFPMLHSEFVVGYRLGRTEAGDTCRDFRIFQYHGITDYEKLFSVYCGDKDLDVPWYGEYVSDGKHLQGTAATVYSDDTTDGYIHAGSGLLTADIRKALYQGYKNRQSQSALQDNLNAIRHHGKSMSGEVPYTRAQAEIRIGTETPKTEQIDISPGQPETRWKYRYTIHMEEESLLSTVSPDGVYAKRTKMRTVTGGQNTFHIIVPDTDIKLWVCTDWKGSIADTDWKAYRSGEEAVLKTGSRYFFTAGTDKKGVSRLSKTFAERDGFTAYAVCPDNKEIQTCFAGVLYEYAMEMVINWGSELKTGKLHLTKLGDGSLSNLKGIKFYLYKLDEPFADLSEGKAVKIGTYTVNSKGKGVPTYITEKGRFYGAKSNYAGEDIDGSTCRNIYNLPPGYYMLHEDAELALARGYLPAIDHYYEITDNQLEYEFVIQNVRGGLSLQKTSDSPELTGADGKTNAYSLQGARYNVYKVGKKNDTSTDAYVCTFTTDASGKGIVTKYNSDAGYYPVYGSDNRIYEVRGVPVGCWYYIAEIGKKKGWNGNEYSYARGYIVNKEDKKAASYYQKWIYLDKEDGGIGVSENLEKYPKQQIDVLESPITIGIQLHKSSAMKEISDMGGYTFADIQYQVYMADKNGRPGTGNLYVGTFTVQKDGTGIVTDINTKFIPTGGNKTIVSLKKKGTDTISGLPCGSYYAKETKTNRYYRLNTDPVKKECLSSGGRETGKKEIEHVIEVTDQPNTGELYLEKKSAGGEWTDENTAYSLLHAEYSVYMVSGKNAPYKEENQVGIFTTEKMNAANTVIGIPEIRNSCGTGNAFRMISGEVVSIQADKSKHCFTGLPFGWYAVKEKRAPKNYKLDADVHYICISPDTVGNKINATMQLAEKEMVYQGKLSLTKYDRENGTGTAKYGASLADAVFQVRYYKGLLQKTELAASAAYRTWYIKTVYNEQTGSYEAKLDAAYLTGQSDPLFTDKKTGAVILPAGTVVITEYQPPKGYMLPGHGQGYIEVTGLTGEKQQITGNEIVLHLDTGNPNKELQTFSVESGNVIEPELIKVYEQAERVDIAFDKINAGTRESMQGIVFRISLLDEAGNPVESHIAVTGVNGRFDSAGRKESGKFNINDDIYEYNQMQEESAWKEYDMTAGIWFCGDESTQREVFDEDIMADGATKSEENTSIREASETEKADLGALLPGTYMIEELPCKGNRGFVIMQRQIVDIDSAETIRELGTYENQSSEDTTEQTTTETTTGDTTETTTEATTGDTTETTTESTTELTTEITTELTTETTTEATTEITTEDTTETTTELTTEQTTEITTETTTELTTEPDTGDRKTPPVRTGDSSGVILFSYIGLGAMLGAAILVIVKRRQGKHGKDRPGNRKH